MINKDLKASKEFSQWGESIGLPIGPEQDPAARVEPNRPAPLGSAEIKSNSSTRNVFSDFLVNTVHFDDTHSLV